MDAEQLRGFRQREHVRPGEGDAFSRKLEMHQLGVGVAHLGLLGGIGFDLGLVSLVSSSVKSLW